MNINRTIRAKSLPIIGGVLSGVFWIIDASVDTFIFNKNHFFFEALFTTDTLELWSRFQVIFLLMMFSFISMMLFIRQTRITQQLQHYKNDLEHIVNQRTIDLLKKNTELEDEIQQRKIIQKELAHLATIDPLTSIPNRRKFDDVLSYELMRDERYQNGLSLILFDLDHFKSINDKFGHNTGDDVLIEITKLVSGHIRNSDIFARWGGEEFVLLLPETHMATAIQIAEKLRRDIAHHNFTEVGRVTASFGVTQYLKNDDESSFINRADQALYRSKTNGRNAIDVLPPLHVLLRLYSNQNPDTLPTQTAIDIKKHSITKRA